MSEENVSAASGSKKIKSASPSMIPSTEKKDFTLITYNIDGLDPKNQKIRCEAVCNIIKEAKADVVFLQEVILLFEKILLKELPEYELISGKPSGAVIVDYFCAILLRKDCVKLINKNVIPLESIMRRNILKAYVSIGKMKLHLLNTHLESTENFAQTRMSQLKTAFEHVLKLPQDDFVILAGDLNLNDSEVVKIGGLPNQLKDVWQETGSKEELKYTWDMRRNDNIEMHIEDHLRPRFRFDRVYLRKTPPNLIAVDFGLVGIQRLKPYVCFPSDHWGILCAFQLQND